MPVPSEIQTMLQVNAHLSRAAEVAAAVLEPGAYALSCRVSIASDGTVVVGQVRLVDQPELRAVAVPVDALAALGASRPDLTLMQ